MARVAFFVGIRDYGFGLEPLSASPRDAEEFSGVLKRREFGRFHQVEPLTDDVETPAVSRATVEERLEQWCDDHEPDDVALLYISGHLIWDARGELFLATNETRYANGSLVRSSAVSGTFIRQCLERSAAHCQIIILDCCLQPGDSAASPSDPPLHCQPPPDIHRCLGGDRRVILASADDYTYSPGQKQDRRSIYTQFLVEGIITGLADGDRNQEISIQELHEYVTRKLSIATPAIVPKLFSASPELTATRIARTQVSDAQRQYCDRIHRIIQRHDQSGSPLSTLNTETLDAFREQLGISQECAQVLQQTVMSPYESLRGSLERYRSIAFQILEDGILGQPDVQRQLATARYRLGLTPASVEQVSQELQYLHELRQAKRYRNALMDALKQEQPLRPKTQEDLADLRQALGISPQDAALINQEIEAYWNTHQQKLEQYRVKFQQAVRNGVAQNSLIREELDNFRQVLGLSNQDIEPIENQVMQAMTGSSDSSHRHPSQEDAQDWNTDRAPSGNPPSDNVPSGDQPSDESSFYEVPSINVDDEGDRLRRLQLFKQEFMEAARRHLPLSPEDEQALGDRQRALNLPDDRVTPVKADVIQALKAEENAYQERVALFEDAYWDAARNGFPLSEDAQSLMTTMKEQLHITEQDARLIGDRIRLQWEQRRTAESAGQSAGQSSSDKTTFPATHTRIQPHLPDSSPGHPTAALETPFSTQVQSNGSHTSSVSSVPNSPIDRGTASHPFQPNAFQSSTPQFGTFQAELGHPGAETGKTGHPGSPLDNGAAAANSGASRLMAGRPTVGNGGGAARNAGTQGAGQNTTAGQSTEVGQSTGEGRDNRNSGRTMPDHPSNAEGRSPAPSSPQSANADDARADARNGSDELASERGIDYRTLQRLTRQHEWEQADAETLGILLELAKGERENVEWLDAEAIAGLPCTDLRTIDRLWNRYSHGRFGFRVQCQIYFGMTTGTQAVSDYSTTFGKRVGWILWDKEFMGFKYYDRLNFDHLNALEGHLPAKWFWKIPWWESVRCGGLGTGRGGCGHDGGVLFAFMKRLVNCKMNDDD